MRSAAAAPSTIRSLSLRRRRKRRFSDSFTNWRRDAAAKKGRKDGRGRGPKARRCGVRVESGRIKEEQDKVMMWSSIFLRIVLPETGFESKKLCKNVGPTPRNAQRASPRIPGPPWSDVPWESSRLSHEWSDTVTRVKEYALLQWGTKYSPTGLLGCIYSIQIGLIY